jgi:uncharacterized protein (TIGR02266 family)
VSTASTRQQKRAPVTLKIKFKSSTLDQFVERYSVDISQGGIFIRTKSPLEVGTPLRFEFQLKNATPLITGEGTVVWTREYDPSRTGLAPGMGVRFDRLPPESQQVLSKILEQKKTRPTAAPRRAPSAPLAEEFVDSPTRVAPRAMIAGLADTSRETFSEDEHVPADAFEEATKVGLLDELVARTAEPEADEPILTSAPRSDSGPIGTAIDFDDVPELPVPLSARGDRRRDDGVVPPDGFDDEILDLPAPARRRPDFPESIPTELNLSPPPPSKAPEDHAPTDISLRHPTDDEVTAARNRDSLDKPATILDSVPPLPDRPPAGARPPSQPSRPSSQPLARERADSSPPPASRPLAATPHLMASSEETQLTEAEARGGGSSALWIAMAVGIILLAGGGFAYWTMTKDDATSTATRPPPRPNPAVDPGATQAAVDAAAEPTGVEATVSSEVEGATAVLVDGDQSGPTPMTFKGLEEGKSYKVTISAPGYLPAEIDLQGGGEAPEPVKLEAKPRFLSVTSTPNGAAVYINKRRRGKTPFEIELKGPLAKVDEYSVELRRAGYSSVEKTIARSDSWSEEDERMIASLDLTLDRRAPRVVPNRNTGGGSDSGDGDSGSGSGKGDGDTGSGSGDGKTGDGDGETGTGSGSGSGEPVPDWAKDKTKKNDEAKAPKPAPAPAPPADPE